MIQDVMKHLEALVSFDTRNPPRAIGTDGIFDYLRANLPGFTVMSVSPLLKRCGSSPTNVISSS